ncbi:hypothetical protein HPB51_022918 [Rhipicephalus microplus]|uniref:Uncharacterized protein n=1 Tax=Rhipicephalus microplus TaxID=6941 RepID=A0A9J6DQ79_RHIMP|nr:hypothetical protein HPB51_022918 [Rhipicephalus microplus]
MHGEKTWESFPYLKQLPTSKEDNNGKEAYTGWKSRSPKTPRLASFHFEPRYVIREYVHVVNGAKARILRGSSHKHKRNESAWPRKKQRLTNTDEQDVADEPSTNNDTHAPLTVADLKQFKLPNNYWTLHELCEDEGVCFTSCSLTSITGEVHVEKAVFFTVDSASGANSRTFVLDKLVAHAAVSTINGTTKLQEEAHEMHICKGAVASNDDYLQSILTEHLQRQANKKSRIVYSTRCHARSIKEAMPYVISKCLRKALHNRQSRLKRRQKTLTRPCLMVSRKLKIYKLKDKRLDAKLSVLSQTLKKAKKESAEIVEEVLAEKMKSLSPKQQLAVRHCFQASKRKSSREMLYD